MIRLIEQLLGRRMECRTVDDAELMDARRRHQQIEQRLRMLDKEAATLARKGHDEHQ